jgi:hypothetical protein
MLDCAKYTPARTRCLNPAGVAHVLIGKIQLHRARTTACVQRPIIQITVGIDKVGGTYDELGRFAVQHVYHDDGWF